MIRNVVLPELTRRRLTDLVWMQICLLEYAASVSPFTEAGCIQALENFTDSDTITQFAGRGKDIIEWLRGKPYELLKAFANATEATPGEKAAHCKQAKREIAALFAANSTSDVVLLRGIAARSWQEKYKEFLILFYNCFLGSRAPNAPAIAACVSTTNKEDGFGRKEFDAQFAGRNTGLHLCCVCDFNKDLTIDHYLPKALYPHLACHPYNLIPVCHACNSTYKTTKDPLELQPGFRQSLNKVHFPYKSLCFAEQSYLEFELAMNWEQVNVGPLSPLPPFEAQQELDDYETLFEIPGRWHKHKETIRDRLIAEQRKAFRQDLLQVGRTQSDIKQIERQLLSSKLSQSMFLEDFNTLLKNCAGDQKTANYAYATFWAAVALARYHKQDKGRTNQDFVEMLKRQ